jgi:uncharacterized SAM-binding protein YcdF (DUF218 family)
MLFYRRPKIARCLLIAAFSLLWVGSTPYFSSVLLRLLEAQTTALTNPPPAADAIVILGSGSYFHAPDYAGQDTVSARALQRVRYGAKLARATHQPILVTGGKPLGNGTSEAEQMSNVLEQEFQVPVRWREQASNNTAENARFSFAILQQAGIKKIYLVTHAWHMPRSAEAFRRAGFEVIEAPTIFTTDLNTHLLTFIPDANALLDTKFFIHEMIGLAWYRLKF